jgi:hypothetical protein
LAIAELSMTDPYEKFVRWYLRFNGYFCVENFIIHRPVGHIILQAGEFDVLAVRFPYSHEAKGQGGEMMRNDERLLLRNDTRIPEEWREKPLTDFVIAEAKSGSTKLNKVWQQDDEDGEMVKRVKYLLRWMGPLHSEATIDSVAKDLQQNRYACWKQYVFRLIQFCDDARISENNIGNVPQISFESIARWIVTARTPCWHDLGYGARSAHPQWDPMINIIWEIGNIKLDMTTDARVNEIVRALEASKN